MLCILGERRGRFKETSLIYQYLNESITIYKGKVSQGASFLEPRITIKNG